MDEKYFLYSVWGSCRTGDRNACLEEFDNEEAAQNGIENLMNDHPDANWQLIRGEEVRRYTV